MMFSKSCEYALKAVIHLCIKAKGESRLNISEISRAIDSPEPFTAKILQTLSRHGIISSIKGPGGGFYIDKKAAPIRVIEIIDLIDGKHAFDRCGLGLKDCNEDRPCPIHKEFKSYSVQLKHLLETKTIQEFAKEISRGNAFLINT